MDKRMSQSFTWDWSLQQAPLVGRFELGNQELIRGIRQSLRGGYQQFMTQSSWSLSRASKQTAQAGHSFPPSTVTIEPVGENVDQVDRVRECVAIKQRGRQVITAVRTLDHRLKLFSWRVNADGAVVRTGASTSLPGRVTQVAIARAHKFVTAFRTAARQLQLISWDVSNTGAIYQAGVSVVAKYEVPEEINKVKLVSLNDHLLVTACTTRTGQLKLSSWRLNEDDSLICLHEYVAAGEGVRDLVPVILSSNTQENRLLLVVHTTLGTLKIQCWGIAQNGEITPPLATVQIDEKISRFDAMLDGEGRLITSLCLANNRLKLVAWQLAPDGQAIQRLCDSGVKGAQIRKHALMQQATQSLTAVQTTAGQIELTAWAISLDNTQSPVLVRVGHAVTQGMTLLAPSFCQEALDGNAPILVSSVTADGVLKLLTWRV